MFKTKKTSKKIHTKPAYLANKVNNEDDKHQTIKKNLSNTIILAPFRRRFFSMVYEQVLVIGLVMLVALIFAVSTHQTHALKHQFALQVCLFMSLGIYFVWPWLKSGQTLAMKTWRVRLLSSNQSNHLTPLTIKQAILRYLLSWIWLLPALAISAWYPFNNQQTALACTINVIIYWLIAYIHSSKQLLHDRLLGVVCVDAPYTE